MKVLVIGRGGREHAILWKLSRDLPDAEFFITRGNGRDVSHVALESDTPAYILATSGTTATPKLAITTRAITIDASPEQVWPWLVQMGETPRGGFYTYEWVERAMGMNVHNAETILAEYQHIKGNAELITAVNAAEVGAFEYVPKPFDLDDVAFLVARALETTQLRREVRRLRAAAMSPTRSAPTSRRSRPRTTACRSMSRCRTRPSIGRWPKAPTSRSRSAPAMR